MTLNLVSGQALVSEWNAQPAPASRNGHRHLAAFAIEVRGICKRYGHRDVLADVALQALPGGLHGLLGPNGAGKTTLMRVMLGLIRADSGSVHLLGAPVRATTDALADGVAGYVDAPAFYPYLSGRRNLELLVRLDNERTPDRRTRVDSALEEVGLSTRADSAVSGYSAGMRQRLGLAAALLRSPRVLLLDEPTSSLDPAAARDVRSLVKRLAQRGTAVVLSSHDMAEIEELCDELTVLNQGRVAYSGSVDALRRRAPAVVHVLHTSDDAAARALGTGRAGLKVRPAGSDGPGIEVAGDTTALDAYTVALGQAAIALRSLERRTRSLESLFLELTGDGRGTAETASSAPTAAASPRSGSSQ